MNLLVFLLIYLVVYAVVPQKSSIFTHIHYIGLNNTKEIYMLNFIKKLFGVGQTEAQAPVGKPAFNEEYVQALEQPKKPLEFHEEIRAQVEAGVPFPVEEKKPAVKAKSNKGKAKPAPVKATAKKAPAKKTAPKKSK